MNRSRICSDKKPDSVSMMRRDAYPFPAGPVKQDPVPEHRADIRSVKERYQDIKRAAGRKDVMEEGRFEEEEE